MKTQIIFFLALVLFFSSCMNSESKGKIEIVSSGFIFDQAPFPQCHASTIVETSDGILASWFGGTHEKHSDVCIYTSSYNDGKWSAPELVADGIINDSLRYPCWNPVLYTLDNGNVVLFYKVGADPISWWGEYKLSNDNGATWSDAIKIPDNHYGPIKNKPERLSDESILFPTSYENSKEWKIYIEKSDQNLNNWRKISIDNNEFNAIQPTILFHSDENIQMLSRSKEGCIVETWSSDSGESWSPVQATSLVNNNSGIDAVTLKNGQHLLVCNPIEMGRNKISLLISDNGRSWKELMVLEDQLSGEFSYPAIIQSSDNSVFITYTYNRKKIKFLKLRLQ